MRTIKTAFFLTVMSCFYFLHLNAQVNMPSKGGTTPPVTPRVINQTTCCDVTSYTGIYAWDDFIQMFPMYSPDSGNTYYPAGSPIMNDINAEFQVSDGYADTVARDTFIVIKYLYFLKDKYGLLSGSNPSRLVSNRVFFHRYKLFGV